MELITENRLKEWTGFKQRADLTKWLINNHIPFTTAKAGSIVTTLTSINSALNKELSTKHQAIDFI